ncbi:MAG: hypothetical protein ACOYN9_13535 [Saprospiraceae bacterium]|jgi:hypothetical protein
MKNLVVFFIVMFLFLNIDLVAQCPMCKMAAESNLKNGGTAGKGLNAGILYMLLTPYLLVGGLAFWWFKNRKKVIE